MKNEKNILKIIETLKYKKENKNKMYLPYYGITTYLGEMGGGKTISAVKECKEIIEKYPEITFMSNVKIEGIQPKKIEYFKNCDELVELLKKIDIENNKGYLILIDEIHVVLAELFRKNGSDFFTIFKPTKKIKYIYNRHSSNV